MVSLTLDDTIKTTNNTKKLPKLAAITKLHFDIKKTAKAPPITDDPIIIRATPKLAPDVIPNTKGPARGFLNKVCINKPEIPKPEPTSIAVKAFGNLYCRIMYSHEVFSTFPKKLLNTVFKGIETDPKLILVKKQNINTTESIRKENLYVGDLSNYSKALKKKDS